MIPKPRTWAYFGRTIQNQTFPDGTWLEGEEFAYPNGSFDRRAYAECEDGKCRVVRCSIPDTYFSIPAKQGKAKGFLSIDEEGLKFKVYRGN